jgi:hypothetical protein
VYSAEQLAQVHHVLVARQAGNNYIVQVTKGKWQAI